MPTSRQPTVDVDDSVINESRGAELAIRWVHPRAHLPPVPLRHGATLGRGEDAAIQLDGDSVSRNHARWVREGPVFVVRDLDSRNGTHVEGTRVGSAALSEGSVLRLGEWLGVIESLDCHTPDPGFGERGGRAWGGAQLHRALEPLHRVATTDLPIIVVGETGTGKELAAKAVHEKSGRQGPFCALNCSALPAEMVEGELFGYRRGAFTGAERSSPGHFRNADGGTLLLDEIGELPAAVQPKLLRVLQEGEVTPLGEATPVRVDVRVVVAGPEPLAQAVAAGRFRQDLYMRLRGLEITLPPLRQRRADIVPLFRRFLERHGAPAGSIGLEAKLLERLCIYEWPGNIRELELTARQMLALHGDQQVWRRRCLPPHLLPSREPMATTATGDRRSTDLERLALALRRTEGNLTRACQQLGISRPRAYRLLGTTSVRDFLASQTRETGA